MAQPLTTEIQASQAGWREPTRAIPPTIPTTGEGVGRRFEIPQAVLDVIGFLIAWKLAISVRVLLNPVMPVHFQRAELERLLPPILLVIFIWMAAMVLLGLYRDSDSRLKRRSGFGAGDFLDALRAGVLVGVVTVLASAYFREVMGATISRSFALVLTPVATVMLLGMRLLARYGTAVWGQEAVAERVAVVGSGRKAEVVADEIQRLHNGSVRLAGMIAPTGAEAGNGIPVLGSVREIPVLINRYGLDRLVVVDTELSAKDLEQVCHTATRMGVVVSRVLDRIGPATKMRLSSARGLPMVEIEPVPWLEKGEIAKRVFDLCAATFLLVILSPLMLAVAAAIKLTSKGPVLYRSQRVGRGGRYFTFLKFRSMYVGTEDRRGLEVANEKEGHLFKIRNDPRVTPVGRWIRRFSIDELPQLINVLRGEMSLVGPRPLPACDLDPDGQSREFAIWSEQRSLVLPGITGLWQVSGRSELTFERMVELDLRYVHEWSFWLDCKILLKTPAVVLAGIGAY